MTAHTVYLLRHGRTRLNAAGSLRGRLDVPLDDVGEQQAAALGDLFHGVDIHLVVASPLRRAADTARAVARAVGAPLRVDPRLTDRDYGPWAGRDLAEAASRYGSIDHAPGVETTRDLEERVTAALEETCASIDGSVAIVAHDAVNRTLLHHLTPGLPASIGQRTGCWNRLDRGRDGTWTAVTVDALPGDGSNP